MSRELAKPSWLNRAYIGLIQPVVNSDTHRGLGRRLRELERLERMSLEENDERQWRALLRLLKHAYETTPFYREQFERAGFEPSDIRSREDLERIPPITREDIRNRLDDLWSRRYQKESLKRAATGGTTDTPVPLLRSPECLKEKIAVQAHLDSWAGMWPGDKVFRLWGAEQDFDPHPSWRWRLYDRGLMRQVWAPTSLLNPSVLESYRQVLNKFRPKIVYAYPTPLTVFCEYLRDCGRPYHRPLSVICTAEPLLDTQRQIIEQTMGCRAFEHYGARDFGMVAAECEQHKGLHLHPAAVFVEFVPVAGAEVNGLHEILVTDLLNFGMPLIRYRVNDCTVPASRACACGRGFPLIQKIAGRTTDNFHLPSGSVVPGVALTNRVIQVCPGLRKIQVIQTAREAFHVRYVPGASFTNADLEQLSSKLKVFFPDELRWTFEEVREIHRERSGKTRFCISHVNGSTTDKGHGKEDFALDFSKSGARSELG
jgi:phenylacetate-coenzyme A ligase PaaK-like adenylate-forming protein